MAKRNNRIDTEVIALAVTGLSQRAIAEKRRKIFLKKFSSKLFHFSKKYVMIKYNLIGESYGGKNFL